MAPLSSEQASTLDKIRTNILAAKLAEDEIEQSSFSELTRIIERRAGVSKKTFTFMLLSLDSSQKSPAALLKRHCADLLKLPKQNKTPRPRQLARTKTTQEAGSGEGEAAVEGYSPAKAEEERREKRNMSTVLEACSGLSLQQQETLEKIRASIKAAKLQTEQQEFSFSSLGRLIESHTKVSHKRLIHMLRSLAGDDVSPAAVLKLHCSDLVQIQGQAGGRRVWKKMTTEPSTVAEPISQSQHNDATMPPRPSSKHALYEARPADDLPVQGGQRLTKAVAQVLEELHEQLEAGTQLVDFQLHVFGSSANGFGDRDADIDVALELSEGAKKTSKKEVGRVLDQVRHVLQGSSFRVLRRVSGRIPLLTLMHQPSKRDIDLSVGNLAPLANTNLLWSYAASDPRVRSLGLYVKRWAKQVGIHGASKGWLSSYDLVLMVLFFLQTSDFELPSLQEIYPTQAWDAAALQDGLLHDLKVKLERNSHSVEGLMSQFFHFYGYVFRWGQEVVSVRLGKIAARRASCFSQLKQLDRGVLLDIEDPFQLSRNLGCHLGSPRCFKEVVAKFRLAST
eukprot:TRINITY_DN11226_c0_g1_i1.p1 TRINITY_DN11226_c0_g1~~TRINITY_DN11226_c0_g1_i1.p1  ORF type:complete len:565 (+),score=83.07 TRINITY_DN11226_c0_g1_i1:68-1762(+)